jgi:cellulose biosynthesis protein BcsQ
MIAVAVFNNKGGVGKTTLTCNLAAHFAKARNLRVLIVDCDPQCNSTQLVMGEEFATKLYWEKTPPDAITTIRDILQPIEDGDSDISKTIVPIIGSKNRFGVDLIPGHPSFSVIEDRLGSAWHELQGGDIGGIRRTNWNTVMRSELASRYDLVFYDLGPSLGSINRSVLIGCNRFATPMGTDIFSILGVRNIASWLKGWTDGYHEGLKLSQRRFPGKLADYIVSTALDIQKGFVGYTMQQYITKSKSGLRRPTKAYEDIINSVPHQIESSLGEFFVEGLSLADAKLGDVPHLYSLIPLAQAVSAPIVALGAADGLVGSQYQQRTQYADIVANVAERLAHNLGLVEK